MKKYFSNSESSFYVEETVIAYRENELPLPPDLFEVTEEEYQSFMVSPDGMTPHYNIKNRAMEWAAVTPPERSLENIIAENQAELMRRQRAAAISAFPLQSAVDLGVASDEVKSQLNDLKKYVVALMEVDVTAPDWPATPEFISI